MSGNATFRRTAEQLFGSGLCGFLHDFPAELDHFAGAVRGYLGSAPSIALTHTVLPYYLLFRPTQRRHDAMAALTSGRITELKACLDISSGPSGTQYPMKACPGCIEMDLRTHGVAYWHLTHQLPGIWLCPAHGLALICSKRSTSDRDRSRYFMPTRGDVVGEESTASLSDSAKPALAVLARVTMSAFANADKFVFDPDRLAETYRLALSRRGLLPNSPDLLAEFLSVVESIRYVPELAELGTHPRHGTTQILRLLREQRFGGNSLHHLVLITWLFGSWEEFFRAYEACDVESSCLDGLDEPISCSANVSFKVFPKGLSIRAKQHRNHARGPRTNA